MQIRGGLGSIVIVFVLHHLQNQMMRPYVPLYAASLDTGLFGVGVVAASAALLPIFFAIPVGGFADRWGVRPIVIVGLLLSGSSYLVLWLVPIFGVIVGCQLVAGLANLLIVLAAQSYVGSLGQGTIAERNFSIYTIYASIGQILGPLLGGVLIHWSGFGATFLVAAALSLLCLISGVLLLPRATRKQRTPGRDRLPRRAIGYLANPPTRLAVLTSCLMSVPEILRTSFLPIYLGAVVQVPTSDVGYVLALFSVAGLGAKIALPRVVGRFGRQVTLFSITVGCAILVGTTPAAASIVAVGAIVVCMGVTFGLGRPLSMAMAANSAAAGDMGVVMGLRLSGNRVADFALPLAFGGAAALGGIGAAFVAGAGLMIAGAAALVNPMIAEIRGRRR